MSALTVHTEQELFRQIAEGNEAAFAVIFHRHRSALFDYGMKITKSVPAAEELVQECFVKLWMARQNLPSIDNPIGYLQRMARNAGVDYLRRLSLENQLHKHIATPHEATDNPTLQRVHLSETQRLIQEAISQLPDQQREVFFLSRQEGLNYQEIGDRLGIAQNTVKNHLVRALKYIREYLSKTYGGPIALIIMSFLDRSA